MLGLVGCVKRPNEVQLRIISRVPNLNTLYYHTWIRPTPVRQNPLYGGLYAIISRFSFPVPLLTQ